MKKKDGFISMTLVYTFLILFMFLMLAILRTYTEKDKFLQAINDQINNDIGVAKGSRVTVINRLLEDNMPNADNNIRYFRISNSHYGNGGNLYYMTPRSYTSNYNFDETVDENADTHTSRIYYFRGSVENNHIVFANKCFRILRTNEDGSIRVVYNGPRGGSATSPTCKKLDDAVSTDVTIGSSKFNDENSVEYVKLVGGVIPSADGSNVQSPIINMLNKWYRDSFFPNDSSTINYTEYISKNTIFCNNKKAYSSTDYYQSRELSPIFINKNNKDIYNDSNIRNIISFKCENIGDRFSVNEGNIIYPVGLLTAQDVVLAGGYLDIGSEDEYEGGPSKVTINSDYYLYDNVDFWTMSPLSNNGKVIYVSSDGSLKADNASTVHSVRPVISLNSNIVIAKGIGTPENPYVVRTSE